MPSESAPELADAEVRRLLEEYLREHPQLATRLRQQARRTATRYTWPQVIHRHIVPMLSAAGPAFA